MTRGLARLVRYRLVIPILRNRQPPEVSARGVMVGVVCAMNPFVGAQMTIVAAIWAIQRLLAPGWRFNVVAALAWTWISNVFTVPAFYYAFLVTGRAMLGRWEGMLGFGAFRAELDAALAAGQGGWLAAWDIAVAMVELWGAPMFLGSVPWAIVGGWIGYRWSLRFVEGRRRAARARRARRKQAAATLRRAGAR